MAHPRLPTVKALFAASGNICAYPRCEEKLTAPDWKSVQGRVAHIRGEKDGAARYDESMTEEERHDYSNLILLCPNCHTRIDDLEPERHTVEMLYEMKALHEQRMTDAIEWAADEDTERYAKVVLRVQFGVLVVPDDEEHRRKIKELTEFRNTLVLKPNPDAVKAFGGTKADEDEEIEIFTLGKSVLGDRRSVLG